MTWAGWLAVIVVVALLASQLAPRLLARRVRGHWVPELEPFLSLEQQSARRLLVYFWSPSCGRCRAMSKAIDELRSNAVVKVDVTGAAPLAQAFHVMATPTVAIVEQGQVRSVLVGVRSRAQLEALLAAA